MSRRPGRNRGRVCPAWLAGQLAASAAGGTAYSFTGPTGQSNTGHYWTPTGYNPTGGTEYPIVYALHGKLGTSGTTMTNVLPRLKDAITALQIRNCIMVAPSVGDTWYANSFDGATPRESQFMTDLVPYFDTHLRSNKRRVLTGFSMGCFGALRLAFKYLGRFRAVYGLAGPNLDADSNNAWAGSDASNYAAVWNSTLSLLRPDSPCATVGGNGIAETYAAQIIAASFPIRLVKSAADSASLASLNNFDSRLTSLGIAHTFVDLVTPTHSVSQYYTADAGAGFAFLEQYL